MKNNELKRNLEMVIKRLNASLNKLNDKKDNVSKELADTYRHDIKEYEEYLKTL